MVTRQAGFEFVTIGSPGNAEVPPEYQSFPTPTPGLGRVNNEYRISRTEVTYGQYFDFVRAYAPLFDVTDRIECEAPMVSRGHPKITTTVPYFSRW